MPHRTFLNHFVLCLALAAALFFATLYGIPQTIWATDVSMVTSLIAVVLVGSAIYIGLQCWHLSEHSTAEFGWFAAETCVRLALVGTTIGLLAQTKTLMSGTAGLLPLSTSLWTTAVGISASIVLNILAYNLAAGLKEARQ